jgi:hypothetical protein
LFWLWDIIANCRNAKNSSFITLFRLIPPSEFISMPQIVIRPNLMWIRLAIDTFSCIPFIRLNSNPEYSIGWIYFLPKVHRMAKFILLLIEIVMKIALDKHCFCYWVTMCFWWKNLLDLLMDWIFLDLTEAEISGIYWPVIWTHFLLSRIVVLVGFQV